MSMHTPWHAFPWHPMMNHTDIYTIDFDGEVFDKPESTGLWIDPDGSGNYQLFDSQAGPKGKTIKQHILERLKG